MTGANQRTVEVTVLLFVLGRVDTLYLDLNQLQGSRAV